MPPFAFSNTGRTLLGGGGSAPGAPLGLDEGAGMERKLRRLTADPLNGERQDREFQVFKTGQYERAFPGRQKLDATGRGILPPPVVRDVEPFKPKVRRDDLVLRSPVGEKAKNKFSDLLGAKRALSNTGLFPFDVTREPSNKAGPIFNDSLKAFQRNRGLKIDGLMNPDGPTVKSLRSVLFPEGHTGNVGKPVFLSRSRGLSGPPITLASAGSVPTASGGTPIARVAAAQPGDSAKAALGDAPPKSQSADSGVILGGEGLIFRPGEIDDPNQIEAQKEIDAVRNSPGKTVTIRMKESREWAIRNGRPARIEVAKNPKFKGEAPLYREHSKGVTAIKNHDAIIEREARRQGVNPDLVRAIMYVENADGSRFGLSEFFEKQGLADTFFPMNIDPKIWGGMGGVKAADFKIPDLNIRASVALIKAIQDRVSEKSPAAIGSVWNFSGRESVNSVGARIQRAFDERLWKK